MTANTNNQQPTPNNWHMTTSNQKNKWRLITLTINIWHWQQTHNSQQSIITQTDNQSTRYKKMYIDTYMFLAFCTDACVQVYALHFL